jgi:hypothetical protein
MPRTREEILENRRRLRAEYGELFDSVAALLFRYDPIGVNFEENTDEYETEVDTILPRLRGCHSADDVLQVVHEEFVRWFDSGTAGPRERYQEIAFEIWRLWQGHRSNPNVAPPPASCRCDSSPAMHSARRPAPVYFLA